MDIPRMGQIARSRQDAQFPELWNGLKLALYPMLGRQGRTLIDWAGYAAPVDHQGSWVRANQYTAVNNVGNLGQVSLGRRILPISGAPRPYSLFVMVRRTNAGGEASILRQFTAAEANRTILAVGTNVRFSVGTDYTSSTTVAVNDVITIAITQNPGVFGQMWINGRFEMNVANSGEASDNNFELDGATRDCDVMAICAWNGKALRPAEIRQLHADPFCVLRQRERTWPGFVASSAPTNKPWLYRSHVGRRALLPC